MDEYLAPEIETHSAETRHIIYAEIIQKERINNNFMVNEAYPVKLRSVELVHIDRNPQEKMAI